MRYSLLFEMACFCQNMLYANGLTLKEVDGLSDFEARMSAIGKLHCHPMMDPARQFIINEDVLCLVLRRDGRDIGGVAAKRLNLGNLSLAEFWKLEYRILYGEGVTLPVTSPASSANDIIGQVAYLGELYLIKSERGTTGVTPALLRYIQCVAFSIWQLDWVYGFIRKDHIEERRKGNTYGFTVQEAAAQVWEKPVQGRHSTEFLVANNRRQWEHLAEQSASQPQVFIPGYEDLLATAASDYEKANVIPTGEAS